MFLILLSYVKSISEVECFIEEHKAFLIKHYDSGNFLLSGRQEPRTGGVILCSATGRREVEQIVEQDPFCREKIAHYQIIEFVPSMTADSLVHLNAK